LVLTLSSPGTPRININLFNEEILQSHKNAAMSAGGSLSHARSAGVRAGALAVADDLVRLAGLKSITDTVEPATDPAIDPGAFATDFAFGVLAAADAISSATASRNYRCTRS
jgi:hypothetical protein